VLDWCNGLETRSNGEGIRLISGELWKQGKTLSPCRWTLDRMSTIPRSGGFEGNQNHCTSWISFVMFAVMNLRRGSRIQREQNASIAFNIAEHTCHVVFASDLFLDKTTTGDPSTLIRHARLRADRARRASLSKACPPCSMYNNQQAQRT
jgi:hypothetical protein